jgi:hypothetical protein
VRGRDTSQRLCLVTDCCRGIHRPSGVERHGQGVAGENPLDRIALVIGHNPGSLEDQAGLIGVALRERQRAELQQSMRRQSAGLRVKVR